MRTKPSGLTVKVSKNISLKEISHDEEHKYYVDGREVTLEDPSPPEDLTYVAESSEEDSDEEDLSDEDDFLGEYSRLTSRVAIHDIIYKLVRENAEYIARNRRGFIVWDSTRLQVSKHIT